MWRGGVKAKLLDERARWLQDHRDGISCDGDVEIVSVTQLLRVLQHGDSSSKMQEQWGVTKHDVSAEGHSASRSLKRPRMEKRSYPAQAGVVAFTSTRLWITGFLRFEPQSQAKKTTSAQRLCLCDATNQITIRLIDPKLELLDALVLVKHWTAVVHSDAALSSSATLEIHGEPAVLQPSSAPTISIQDALSALHVQFPTADPPMYVGSKPWGFEAGESPRKDAQKQKKRKFHVVFGRVTSVSPIAVQDDASNSHFFVEVESYNDGNDREHRHPATAVVNVLLAGPRALQWHHFLWPGLLVMLTNLKKVYYAGSEMFLLQAVLPQSSPSGPGDAISSLHVWRLPRESPQPSHLFNPASSTMMDCEGVVTSIIWDECLVLESKPPVTVALFHYPWSDIKAHIRVGARVRVHQAHVLGHLRPGHQRIVLGLCPRSHLRVTSHAPAHSQLHAPPRQLTDTMHRRHLHRKWSYFGDFGRQPLAVSMWWLQLLENLVQKFRFSSDNDDRVGSDDDISFPCIRRREATLVIGQKVFAGTASHSSPANASSTLARRFLNSHAQDCNDCPSVNFTGSIAYLADSVVTIQALRAHIADLVQQKLTDAASTGESFVWPVRIQAHEISGLCVVGVLRGLAESNDLHIADRTAAIPVVIELPFGSRGVKIERGCGVYSLKTFGAIVEQPTTQPQAHEPTRPAYVISLTASVCDLQRVSLCSRHHAAVEQNGSVKRSSVLIFVTDIGPWKRRGRNLSGVTDFRHVRGIGFRTEGTGVNSDPDWSSAHCVDVLVSVDCECWFMQQHAWLRLVDVTEHSSTAGTTTESRLARWFLLMKTSVDAGGNDYKMNEKDAVYEDNAQATWAKSAEQDASMGKVAATYIVDRGSFVCPVAIAQSQMKTNECLVEPNQVLSANPATLRCLRSLKDLARRAKRTHTVQDLFKFQQPSNTLQISTTSATTSVDPHAARLINLVGVVAERTLYYKIQRNHTEAPGEPLASGSVVPSGTKHTRMCRFKIRDLRSLEAVAITVDEDGFGTHSALQPGVLVEFAKLQFFLARNSFKPFITWTHCSTARRVDNGSDHNHQQLSDAQIIGQMPTTLLGTLYKSHSVDRTIKRVVVRLVHVSYVVLKRRCRQCRQPLTLVKRQRMWIHTVDIAEDESSSTVTSQHKCVWKQLSLDSPVFNQQTQLSCSMRCIIDDGSAQCELFLENDIVWELLRCSGGQRRRFEDLLQRQTSELSYYATRSSADALFTSPSAQENLYYQNEWRAFVEDTVQAQSSVIVLAQRFYKSQQSKDSTPHTAVLAFGKDIQITTPRVPLAQLEAIRVDELSARHELRRRLVGHAAKGS